MRPGASVSVRGRAEGDLGNQEAYLGRAGQGWRGAAETRTDRCPWTAPACLPLPPSPAPPLGGGAQPHPQGRTWGSGTVLMFLLPSSKTGTEIQVKNHQEIKWGRDGAMRHMARPLTAGGGSSGLLPPLQRWGRSGKSHRNGANKVHGKSGAHL